MSGGVAANLKLQFATTEGIQTVECRLCPGVETGSEADDSHRCVAREYAEID